jgi:hypothetical protein
MANQHSQVQHNGWMDEWMDGWGVDRTHFSIGFLFPQLNSPIAEGSKSVGGGSKIGFSSNWMMLAQRFIV